MVRDEGEEYARRLRDAGVAVTAMRYLGTVHNFVPAASPAACVPGTRAAVRQGGAFLAEALHGRR